MKMPIKPKPFRVSGLIPVGPIWYKVDRQTLEGVAMLLPGLARKADRWPTGQRAMDHLFLSACYTVLQEKPAGTCGADIRDEAYDRLERDGYVRSLPERSGSKSDPLREWFQRQMGY